ncbi:MAG: hypothetical protein AAGA03_04790 [Planctomycetota bacterium]
MGARILIQSGIAAGTSHWIERSVIRIGNDPGMDLTIPSDSLAPHSLTVEYRGGSYRVHNRSTDPVFLGGRTVAPNQSDTWIDSDLLELPGPVQLAIECDADPTPAAAPIGTPAASPATPELDAVHAQSTAQSNTRATDRSAAQSATPGASDKPSSNTLLQVVVILVCVVGGALLLVRHQIRQTAETTVPVASFSSIVQQVRQSSDSEMQKLLHHLQYAEAAMVRGDRRAARKRFGKVRNMLRVGESSDAPEQVSMMKWVDHRLRQL